MKKKKPAHRKAPRKKRAENPRTPKLPPALVLDIGKTGGEEFLFAYIRDLSNIGVFIGLRPGQAIRLRAEEGGQPFEVEGTMVWQSREGEAPGIGVQLKTTPHDVERLIKVVKTFAYLDEDGAP